jgi:hypothetical protein
MKGQASASRNVFVKSLEFGWERENFCRYEEVCQKREDTWIYGKH